VLGRQEPDAMNTTGAAVREPSLLLEPAVHARGTVTLPGSKSISNRALLLAALAMLLEPAVHARGTVTLPGSKSISNRALLLAALAEGETELEGLLDSDD